CWLVKLSCVLYMFFFSSRRRHTRFSRDWSSDVCSSDLGLAHALAAVEGELRAAPAHRAHHLSHLGLRLGDGGGGLPDALPLALRSEERRVGKECRCRGARDR